MRNAALCLIALLFCGCMIAHEEPAVRGMPRDDPRAPVSAVWVGHATVLLRIGNRTVLADPNLSGSIIIVPRETPPSLQPWELPPVDVALLSHMHLDHFDAPTLRKLGSRPLVVYPHGGEAYDDEILQPRKRALSAWESVETAGLRITAVPVRHQGGRYGLDSLWNHAYTGYVIEGFGHRIFFAGDTGYDPGMFQEIGKRFPGIELAFIPIAPGKKEGKVDRWGHANPREALDIFADVGARYMVPIHFEAYYSKGTDHGAPRRQLLAAVHARGLEGRVFALHTGERVVLESTGPLVIHDVPGKGRLALHGVPEPLQAAPEVEPVP
ncbi:MAG TPA: MBL fold metallo-hydrolase [Myxococcales bacterium]|nr:MBL fold metallo-hydrolase [Myxococcales bacterium]